MVIHRFQDFLGMMFSAPGASFESVKGVNEEKTAPSRCEKDYGPPSQGRIQMADCRQSYKSLVRGDDSAIQKETLVQSRPRMDISQSGAWEGTINSR